VSAPTQPDIELAGLVDLDAAIPCAGTWVEEPPCPQPATWRLRATCLPCGGQSRTLVCDVHRQAWLGLRPQIVTRCCDSRDFRWDWTRL
jgi:hypothetical protein